TVRLQKPVAARDPLLTTVLSSSSDRRFIRFGAQFINVLADLLCIFRIGIFFHILSVTICCSVFSTEFFKRNRLVVFAFWKRLFIVSALKCLECFLISTFFVCGGAKVEQSLCLR